MKDGKNGGESLGARICTRLTVATALLSILPAGAVTGLALQGDATREVVALAESCLDLRSGPNATAPSRRCLPSGTTVAVLESRESWLRVRLADGQEGWVSRELIGPATEASESTTSGPQKQDLAPSATATSARSLASSQETADTLENELARLRDDNQRLTASAAASARVKTAVQQQLAARQKALETAQTGQKELEDRASALQKELAELSDDNQRLTTLVEASARAEAEVQQQLSARQEAFETAQASEKELEDRASALQKELAELSDDNQRLTALVEASARAEAELQQQLSATQEALEAAQVGNKELEDKASVFDSKLAELRDDNQRLSASLEESARVGAEALRRLSLNEDALATARDEAAAAGAEKLELETRFDTLKAENIAEQERVVDDYDARLRAAEIFLSESEAKRRESAEQLEALRLEKESLRARTEPEASDETAAAEPNESNPQAPAARQPERQPREISQPQAKADDQEPMAAVEAWARAWSEQRADEYLSFYSRTFVPQDGASREEWEAERKRRIATPSRIEVRVALIDLRWDSPNRVEIEFLQSYDSDSFSDTVVKTLELVREDSAWMIATERVE